ncbi:DUF480 domain-containing protein [Nibricoccus aquaticus]|uniref:DUF480 domain-containing protein n=1 Tax=Nibricoccus aquaticus TaxID=2576891 RepID=A0A290QK34_9BACT|nr:DUF480 domain-containing protein [Nibricoccus aquaticus]ATC64232.1 DUF480 domain-containing protein [Nibricoccus aquaticus]
MDVSLPISPALSLLEGRVLGCLIEKAFTTPDLYPLTMNALVLACNQKSNRDPVLAVGEPEVGAALAGLREKRLVSLFAGADARVAKYRHTFEQVFPLDFSNEKTAWALIAELLLRGPQTGAGLRGNCVRMVPSLEGEGVDGVEALLGELAARAGGGLVQKLARQPGQKEARWAQRIADEAAGAGAGMGTGAERGKGESAPLTVALAMPPEVAQRLTALEAEVAGLRGELAELKKALGGG